MPFKQFRLMCIAMIVGGACLGFSRLILGE